MSAAELVEGGDLSFAVDESSRSRWQLARCGWRRRARREVDLDASDLDDGAA
jgi:hypothetical protein